MKLIKKRRKFKIVTFFDTGFPPIVQYVKGTRSLMKYIERNSMFTYKHIVKRLTFEGDRLLVRETIIRRKNG